MTSNETVNSNARKRAIEAIVRAARIVTYYTSWENAHDLLEVLRLYNVPVPQNQQELVDYSFEGEFIF